MALSGLEIFKQLPKTNCGDCAFPTCLAFAMKLAASQAELASCPHVSEAAKAALSEASAPPMRAVTVGVGDTAFTVGEETVLFRHEKTFVNSPAIGVTVDAGAADDAIDAVVAQAVAANFERVQQVLRCGFVAVRGSGDASRFAEVVGRIQAATDLPLVLMSEDPAEMAAALEVAASKRPLIHAATEANADAMIELAKKHECPLAVRAAGVEAVVALAEKAAAADLKDIVLDTIPTTAGEQLRDLTFSRRSALTKKFAPLGYPSIVFPGELAGGDDNLEVVYAAVDLLKYGSIIVMSGAEPWRMLPLLVLRQNIFTDPQRPMQAEAKIYEFGNPGPDAPFFITTNFSLTYFIVAGEIEASKAPAYLGIVDAEGLSVLTAWAAGKFVPERIAKFVNESEIAEKLAAREVIIPGVVAQMSGELAEELGNWNVTVGPAEAADIPAFLKRRAS
jgi:acetyl-CoA decarbonylase/synthase, CODH/ACS complex subunit gamma